MNILKPRNLLGHLATGGLSVDDAIDRLKSLPFEELEHATLDTHRSLRQGFPEVIFGSGKSSDQIISIGRRMTEGGENIL
ncbi:MAG: 1-(5-phosphoribosyl)-5-amino-4-imidazole-carboxylate carboxylase, partial [Deltaproteobacteria bacterium]|nr:1-(5-phosphoribosyl)-5-amino-4-imidazole-carboxylate carboxylase [Deltaproteobacteria bacterium]